jgi:hypothetical protein
MTGYYQTSNVNIPLNHRPKGEIAAVAIDQLKVFQDRAHDWPTREMFREDINGNSRHLRACSFCDQAIYFYSDVTGILYNYSDEELLTLVVAHIRQKHERLATRGN